MGKELDFLETKWENSAGFHPMIAQWWRWFGEPQLPPAPLVYSALEYRISIERIVIELYALIKSLKYIGDEDSKKTWEINRRNYTNNGNDGEL